jgi:hypothetical protein
MQLFVTSSTLPLPPLAGVCGWSVRPGIVSRAQSRALLQQQCKASESASSPRRLQKLAIPCEPSLVLGPWAVSVVISPGQLRCYVVVTAAGASNVLRQRGRGREGQGREGRGTTAAGQHAVPFVQLFLPARLGCLGVSCAFCTREHLWR